MFSSGFAEASSQKFDVSVSQSDAASTCDAAPETTTPTCYRQFEDSDDEDEYLGSDASEESKDDDISDMCETGMKVQSDVQYVETVPPQAKGEPPLTAVDEGAGDVTDGDAHKSNIPGLEAATGDVENKSHSEGPDQKDGPIRTENNQLIRSTDSVERSQSRLSGEHASRHSVFVRDVAYTTYRAVLYYVCVLNLFVAL